MIMREKRILIVDDEPDVLELLSYNFRKNGYKVFTKSDGLSGFLAIEHIKPDIIILDIMMPLFDGVMMCNHLKKDAEYSEIPILFLSAATNKSAAAIAREAHQHYICKPVQFNILLEKVKGILETQVTE